jgi:hypothetical protein
MASPITSVTQTPPVAPLPVTSPKAFSKPAANTTAADTVRLSNAAQTALQEAKAGDLQTRRLQNQDTVAEKAGGR